MKPIIWNNCYDSSWNGIITDDSFQHPAKMSRGLIERIIKHGFEQGYWKRGDTIGDCFGGVGTTGIIATYQGLRVVSVELEPKSVSWAEANIALHRSRWSGLGYQSPRIIQGDSRKFDEVIGPIGAVVTSPPYAVINAGAGGLNHKPARKPGQQSGRDPHSASQIANPRYGDADGQIAKLSGGSVDAVISSPPFVQTQGGGKGINAEGYQGDARDLGARTYQANNGERTPDNIEKLPAGELSAVIASPPYADSVNSEAHGIDFAKAKKDYPGRVMHEQRVAMADKRHSEQSYGKTKGQIGALHSGEIKAVITSPPYAQSIRNVERCGTDPEASDRKCGPHSQQASREGYGDTPGQIGALKAVVTSPPWEKNCEGGRDGKKLRNTLGAKRGNGATDAAVLAQSERDGKKTYGNSEGQIGQEKAETYWEAMREVYAACFRAIRPGGVICIVVKDYVKKKKRAPLCDDTARLLEHIGFTVIERIHAMLVSETEHNDLFEGTTTTKKERKSFFRRLAEKKGSPEINWEEVVIARKP